MLEDSIVRELTLPFYVRAASTRAVRRSRNCAVVNCEGHCRRIIQNLVVGAETLHALVTQIAVQGEKSLSRV